MVSKLPEHVGTTCNCISSLHAAGTGMWGEGGGEGGGALQPLVSVCFCMFALATIGF